MCKAIAVLALVALATAAPVITLDLDESVKIEQPEHGGGYGVGCNHNPALCRPISVKMSESKFVHSCEAGKSSTANCPLPTAVGYDHHEGDISEKVTFKTYMVNKNGSPHSGVACADTNCINYNLRSEWVTKFDLCDSSSNCADTVVFANILNDIDPPVLNPVEVAQIEACSGSSSFPVATANDNCNSDGVCSSKFNQPVSVTVTPISVDTTLSGKCSGESSSGTWTTKDNAGMFGAKGTDNTAEQSFTYTIKDTTNPVCTATAELDVECIKDSYYDLKSGFSAVCTDDCGLLSNLAISIPDSYPRWPHATAPTTFSFTQSDVNCNVGTVTSRIRVEDTTPPVLKISNGGIHHMAQTVTGIRCKTHRDDTAWTPTTTCVLHRHANGNRHKIKCALDDETKCPVKDAMVDFSFTVARELGYEWESESPIRLAIGRKNPEEAFVKELMSPDNGYKCSDACGGSRVAVSIHRNVASPDEAIDCADVGPANVASSFDFNYPGLHFIKYVCTDDIGLTTTKCRTLDNHKYQDAVKAYITVPSTISNPEVLTAVVDYFKEDHVTYLNVKSKDVKGSAGIISLDEPLRRRMLESCPAGKTCFRKDTVVINTLRPYKVSQALDMCEFPLFLTNALAVKCTAVVDEKCVDEDKELCVKEFVCVRVEVEPPFVPGAPLIVVPEPQLMELEAYSNWDDEDKPLPQDPDLVDATKAYCIDPCDKDDIRECPGRLPINSKTHVEIPAGACVDPKDPDVDYPAVTSFTSVEGVNMNKIGEYVIVYDCVKVVGTKSLEAIPKERVVKVRDTTKPSCPSPTATVTREASFPYSPDVPVCLDTYWGNQGKQPATVTIGTFDVEKTGSYTLTYTATDHSSNVATQVKQTIIVVDTLKPVIELSYGAKTFHRSDALDTGVNDQANPKHSPIKD